MRHWLGLHGPKPAPGTTVRDAAEADAESADKGDYLDVHAWIFFPRRFLDLIVALGKRKLIDLHPVAVHDTAFPQLELFAVLERAAPITNAPSGNALTH